MIILADRLSYADLTSKGRRVRVTRECWSADCEGVIAKTIEFATLKGAFSNSVYRVGNASERQIACWRQLSRQGEPISLPASLAFGTRSGQALASALDQIRAEKLRHAIRGCRHRDQEEEIEAALDFAWLLCWSLAKELDSVLRVYAECEAFMRRAHVAFSDDSTGLSLEEMFHTVRDIGATFHRVQCGGLYNNARSVQQSCKELSATLFSSSSTNNNVLAALENVIGICTPGLLACRTDMLAQALSLPRRLKVVLDADTLTLVSDGLLETVLLIQKLTTKLFLEVRMPELDEDLWRLVEQTQTEGLELGPSTLVRLTNGLFKMRPARGLASRRFYV